MPPAVPDPRQHDRASQLALASTHIDEQLTPLFDATEDYAVALLNADGVVVRWNAAASALTGYPAAEVIGRHHSMLYPRDDARARTLDEHLARAAASGGAVVEGWQARKDGTYFWANVELSALRSADGALRGFASAMRDDSAARAAREVARAVHHVENAVQGECTPESIAYILNVVARTAREVVGAARAWIAVPHRRDKDVLFIVAADGVELGPRVGDHIPCVGTIAHAVMSDRSARVITDLSVTASAVARLAGFGAALSLPLLSHNEAIGVLTVAATKGGRTFRTTDLEILAPFAAYAAIGVRYSALLRAASNHISAEDRERIVGELRRSVIRPLFALGLTLESVAVRAEAGSDQALIEQAVGQLDGIIRQVRNSIVKVNALR